MRIFHFVYCFQVIYQFSPLPASCAMLDYSEIYALTPHIQQPSKVNKSAFQILVGNNWQKLQTSHRTGQLCHNRSMTLYLRWVHKKISQTTWRNADELSP